jgi:hypothetical protein
VVKTNFMALSPSREAARCAGTEGLNILWNPKVQFRVHKNSPLVLILNLFNPVHITPSYLSLIRFNIKYPRSIGIPSGPFAPDFPTNILCTFILHAQLILLD